MPLSLREATPDECPSLSDLCLRSKAVWGYDAAFMDACRRELTLVPDELRRTSVVVADTGEGPAGVAQIAVAGSDADLLKLFVEPGKVGRGIGRRLFAWAVDEAARRGAARLLIESDPGAASFYRRMGARDIGFAPSGSIPGRLLPKLAYELPPASIGKAV